MAASLITCRCGRENGFLPDLAAIPEEIARRAKVMWLNYPEQSDRGHRGAWPSSSHAIDYCLKHNIILAHDFAYSEIAFDGYRAPSVLEFEGARECAIEFHSLSKTYSMTGWRVGFVVGNATLVGALGTVKTNVDSGVFQAVQEAAIAALTGGEETLHEYCAIYQERRDLMVEALARTGPRLRCPARNFLHLGAGPSRLYLGVVYRARIERDRRGDYAGLRFRQGG